MTEGICKGSSCLGDAWEAFVSRNHRIAEFTAAHNGRDKLIKFVVAVFGIINAAIHASGRIDRQTEEGLKATHDALKITRAITGLMNAVGDIPGSIKDDIEKVYFLAKDILYPDHEMDEEEEIRRKELGVLPEDGYSNNGLKILGICSRSLNVVGSLAFLGAFGIARPLQVAEMFFKNLGETTKKIGSKFTLLMMISHIAVITSAIADMVREGISYHTFKNSADEGQYAKAAEKAKKLFDAMKSGILKLVENCADLGLDVIHVFHYVVPIAVTLTLGLVTAIVGLYNAWDQACKSAEAKGNAAYQRREDHRAQIQARKPAMSTPTGISDTTLE